MNVFKKVLLVLLGVLALHPLHVRATSLTEKVSNFFGYGAKKGPEINWVDQSQSQQPVSSTQPLVEGQKAIFVPPQPILKPEPLPRKDVSPAEQAKLDSISSLKTQEANLQRSKATNLSVPPKPEGVVLAPGHEWVLKGTSWQAVKTPVKQAPKLSEEQKKTAAQQELDAAQQKKMVNSLIGMLPFDPSRSTVLRNWFSKPNVMANEAKKKNGGLVGTMLSNIGSAKSDQKQTLAGVLSTGQRASLQGGIIALFKASDARSGGPSKSASGRLKAAEKWMKRNPNKLQGSLVLFGGRDDKNARNSVADALVTGFGLKNRDAALQLLDKAVPLPTFQKGTVAKQAAQRDLAGRQRTLGPVDAERFPANPKAPVGGALAP